MRAVATAMAVCTLVPLGLACSGDGDGSRSDLEIGEVRFLEPEVFPDHVAVDVRFESEGATLAGTLYLPNRPGPHPVVAFVHGSDAVPRLPFENFLVMPFVEAEIAFFSYDKRGVAESEGECCPGDEGEFDLLAADAAGAVDALAGYAEIDSARIGFIGESQAGWVVPQAVTRSRDVSFAVLVSGPTVSVGEEGLYSELTETGVSIEQANARVREEGPSEFDPAPDLRRMTTPTLWLYGAQDQSIPVGPSVEILEDLITAEEKSFTIHVFPDVGHVVYHDERAMPTIIEWILDVAAEPGSTE